MFRPVELVPDLESILQGGPSAVVPTSSIPVPAASTVPATAPPPPLSPAPAPKSEFKELILANQIPALDPVIISAPLPANPVINCPNAMKPTPQSSFIAPTKVALMLFSR